MVKPCIEKENTILRESMSAEEWLIVTLRYLTTGRSYKDMKFSAAISPQLLSSVIPETCASYKGYGLLVFTQLPHLYSPWTNSNLPVIVLPGYQGLCRLMLNIFFCLGRCQQLFHVASLVSLTSCVDNFPEKYGNAYFMFQLPSSEQEWEVVAAQFEQKWNFSHAVGAVDGKHAFFSVILFAIVNANYEFMYVHVGTNGCVSDATVLQNTIFYRKLINNDLSLPPPSPLPGSDACVPFVFLDDNFLEPGGLWKIPSEFYRPDFEIFGNLFQYMLRKRTLLSNKHNITPSVIDQEDTDNMQFRPGEWRETNTFVSIGQSDNRQVYEDGRVVRKLFTHYINYEGKVPFQAV
ncbi:hypothetical protein PR048_005567 [Dryococelus australis]|uniref:DDE Tnp4 domain-containing protein n=1 Tax=Dryococelus australis TaxID=614101 RepID=A0ABQ9I9H6_9NEOP|nr:hypothetical protein PR048_005567 [Dryococelus australis]